MIDACLNGMFVVALNSSLLFWINFLLFRRLPGNQQAGPQTDDTIPRVSVIVPVRDEEAAIKDTLQRVLASRNVQLDVVVVDDHSRDATAWIVKDLAGHDDRIRLIPGKQLPAGWCGKQYACFQGATEARYAELVFLDADVKLQPHAVARAVQSRIQGGLDLLSGFPRQRTGSLGEAMLIPMMHLVLLQYLPFLLMKLTRMPSASAGCGQFMVTSREAYEHSKGHSAIRATLHDGILLPRLYRKAGLRTDLFDAADLASCRMYDGWQATRLGLLKNAHEGIANGKSIGVFTLLMGATFVLPTMALMAQLAINGEVTSKVVVSFLLGYLTRLALAIRFDRAWLAALLLPVSVCLFLSLQWTAFVRHCAGKHTAWRGREYSLTT